LESTSHTLSARGKLGAFELIFKKKKCHDVREIEILETELENAISA